MSMVWITLTFFLSSIPTAVLIGRFMLGVDIREYGDGNPGATNVLRAGGKVWFVIAILTEGFKAAIPVGIAYFVLGYRDWEMLLIGWASIAGHAFSPFLRFRGGKAIAVTFGLWTGLTIWEGPTVLGFMLAYWYLSLKVDGWVVMFMLISFFIYLFFTGASTLFLLIWLGNILIVAYRHRTELQQKPGIKVWLPFKRYQHLKDS